MSMPMHIPMILRATGVVVLMSLLLTGCDDDDSSPANLRGTAAIGAPLAGGAVELRCNNGQQFSTRTAADGRWAATVPEADQPCVARATTADGLVAFFAVVPPAAGAQTVNITPLTSLVVARVIGADPAAGWFTGLDDGARAALVAGLPAAISAVRQSLRDANYDVPADFDPQRHALAARRGDPHDAWLEEFSARVADNGQSYSQAFAQYAATGGLPISQIAQGTEASGSWQITKTGAPSRTVVPSAGGFWVISMSDGFRTTLGFLQVTTRLANGMPVADSETLYLEMDGRGDVQQAALSRQETGQPPEYFSCEGAGCSGVAVAMQSGGVVTVSMGNVRMGDATVNGTVTGRAPRATWQVQDLPRTSTGTLTINGVAQQIFGANAWVLPGPVAYTKVALDIGGPRQLVLWQYVRSVVEEGQLPVVYQGIDGFYDSFLELVGSSLVCEVQPACGVMLASAEDGVHLSLDGAVFREASTGALSSVSGSMRVQTEYGRLDIAGMSPAVLESTEMFALADGTLMLAVNIDGGSILIATRDGQVLSVEVRAMDHVSGEQVRLVCGRHYVPGASFVVPPCTGVTTNATGLEIRFDAAQLVNAEGQSHALVAVDGEIHATGL